MSAPREATEDWKGAESLDKDKEYTSLLSRPDFPEDFRNWESWGSIIKEKVQVQLRPSECGFF